MVMIRADKHVSMPPPAYHPESQTITVAFFYGGELKNLPVATCIGGKVKKFDYVNATHMNKSNLGLFAEKCGFTDVEGIRYYIMKNYGFKILLSDAEILESALEQLGKYREWCVYIEYNPPLPEEVAVNTGEEERIVHNTENRKGKGKIDGKGKGKAKKKLNFAEDIEYLGTDMEFLGETINVNENVDMVGLSRDNPGVDEPSRRGDVGVDDPDIEEDESDSDFLENDYDMNNDNSEDDDELFKEYVNETEDEHGTGLETSSESDSDDVVVSEADMDEHRVSDDDDKGSEHAVFNPAQIYDPSLELGMIFSSKAEFKKALKKLEGTPEHQFSKLWDYAEELRRTNPGSTIILGVNDESGENRFEKFYVCFSAMKDGFLGGCRPIIGVDGCHLKGPHGGILLTAVGVDPNNNLFCVRHLHNNMKTAGFRGLAYKNALWKAARASTVGEFKLRMEEIKALDQAAFDWLHDKPAQEWRARRREPDEQPVKNKKRKGKKAVKQVKLKRQHVSHHFRICGEAGHNAKGCALWKDMDAPGLENIPAEVFSLQGHKRGGSKGIPKPKKHSVYVDKQKMAHNNRSMQPPVTLQQKIEYQGTSSNDWHCIYAILSN
ncbi:UNVERIFIED_CONTAM: hypothetical protein Sradi_3359000 [Sesamum radiatum]|uniref:MULE transposase domain-containing protein n=1 Tax=Sesamum radiatum TaxID=300843 RepID=A0AAW2R4D1_SESRA